MAASPGELLAQAHMRDQVKRAAIVQAALAQLWEDTLDPNDLTRSFLAFREQAVVLINGGRVIAGAGADDYYAQLRALSGLPGSPVSVPSQNLEAGVIKSSLSAACGPSLARAEAAIAKGADPSEALSAALSQMLGSSKRQVLNASRQRLLTVAARDKTIRGWSRVSDGGPCGFCAMLVGRGPVYDDASVGFRAHDRCGCSARLVTFTDSDKGWSDEARAYRAAYDSGALVLGGDRKGLTSARWPAGYSAADALREFRKAAA